MSDTGNLVQIRILDSDELPPAAFPPNGRTFFHRPAGRRCDGRLIIDFLGTFFYLYNINGQVTEAKEQTLSPQY